MSTERELLERTVGSVIGWPSTTDAVVAALLAPGGAVDVITTAAVAASRAAQDGATCGDLSPSINFGGDAAARLMCDLPVGHGGAHQHDNGDGLPPTRWVVAPDGGAEEARDVWDDIWVMETEEELDDISMSGLADDAPEDPS